MLLARPVDSFRLEEPTRLEVVLDYTTPRYRDCSVGKYLYSCLPDLGFDELVAEGSSKQHIKYLKKMGFHKDKEGHYTLDLTVL